MKNLSADADTRPRTAGKHPFMDGKCVVSVIDRKTMDFYGARPRIWRAL